MDENKNFNEENLEETIPETVEKAEEAIEEVIEKAEETVEEVIEEAEDAVEEVLEKAEEIEAKIPQPIKKNKKLGAIIAIVVAVLAVVIGAVTSQMDFNKYNNLGYINVSGQTVQDVLDVQNMELSEFLEMYGLPEDMPATTYIESAQYLMTMDKFAEIVGLSLDEVKTTLKMPEHVTGDFTFGDAEGEILLKDYVGEENIENVKVQYGLDSSVNGETKWGDVRNHIHQVQYDVRLAEEKAAAEKAKEAEKQEQPVTDAVDDAEGTEATAE